ncbi:MAG: hypothetical protein AAFN94_09395, partial [Pseudomonadota bacterium]
RILELESMTAFAVIDPADLEAMVRRVVREELGAAGSKSEWVTKKELAKSLGRDVRTVERRINSGELETRDVCGVVMVRLPEPLR